MNTTPPRQYNAALVKKNDDQQTSLPSSVDARGSTTGNRAMELQGANAFYPD